MWLKATQRIDRFYHDELDEDYLEFTENSTVQVSKEVGEYLTEAYGHLFEEYRAEDESLDDAEADSVDDE